MHTEDAPQFIAGWEGWGFKGGKTKHRYMKNKKEEYLWRKKTKDIKRNGKKVLDGRR